MKHIAAGMISLTFFLLLSPATRASYITDIGYGALQAQLGAATPTGAGVKVTQVEAARNDTNGGDPIHSVHLTLEMKGVIHG